jgi:hypothetical protein
MVYHELRDQRFSMKFEVRPPAVKAFNADGNARLIPGGKGSVSAASRPGV